MNILLIILFSSLLITSCNSTVSHTMNKGKVHIDSNTDTQQRGLFGLFRKTITEETLSLPLLLMQCSTLYYKKNSKWPDNYNNLLSSHCASLLKESVKRYDAYSFTFSPMGNGSLEIKYIVNSKNGSINGNIIVNKPEINKESLHIKK